MQDIAVTLNMQNHSHMGCVWECFGGVGVFKTRKEFDTLLCILFLGILMLLLMHFSCSFLNVYLLKQHLISFPCKSCIWHRLYMMTSSNGNISALLAICAGNSPVPVNSPHKGQWRGSLMFSLICVLKKRLSKQLWGWWFETPSRPFSPIMTSS